MRAASLALGALLVTAAAAPTVAKQRATQQEVEEALTCQCGCGLTVHACNHLQCGSGEPIKKEISERLARGEDKDTILAAFRERFGEKVLSSPTFGGFNWFAWVTPFAAVLAGGLGIAVAVRRWSHAPSPPPEAPRPSAGDDDLRRRLARELDDLDKDDS
jgi:cytochrome c-type biogenesis protein CcmH/NrfF